MKTLTIFLLASLLLNFATASAEGITLSPFDIPKLKLNYVDLQKIFERGSESSGGMIVPRINMPTRNVMNTMDHTTRAKPTPLYSCSIKLLGDGGKNISWLSWAQTTLGGRQWRIFTTEDMWVHGLISTPSFDAKPVIIPMLPPYQLANYSLTISVNSDNMVELKACHLGLKQVRDEFIGICSTGIAPIKSQSVTTRFSYITNNTYEHQTSTISLDVNCKRPAKSN